MSTALFTLALTTSCVQETTPDTLSGTYCGEMEVELNIPNLQDDDWTLTNRQVVVTRVDDSHVDITLDLNLAQYVNIAITDENLDFGTITARCLVGPTIKGETPLSGTATIARQAVPVWGEYDERVLDIGISLGIVTVEFEGVKHAVR